MRETTDPSRMAKLIHRPWYVVLLAFALTLGVGLTPADADAKRRKGKRSAKATRAISIPAGNYVVALPGDARVNQTVKLTPFDIDRNEVTVADYRACVLKAKCSEPKDGTYFSLAQRRIDFKDFCNWAKPSRDGHPVNCIDRKQAAEYCAFRGRRLPSSDQWEAANYASAAPKDRTKFTFGGDSLPKAASPAPVSGDSSSKPSPTTGARHPEDLCWQRKNQRLGTCAVPPPSSKSSGRKKKRPAKHSKKSKGAAKAKATPEASAPKDVSPRGVVGLTGNVSEWTRTDICPPTPDGKIPSSCLNPSAVTRGGNWYNDFAVSVGATRSRLMTAKGYDHTLGFRCVSK